MKPELIAKKPVSEMSKKEKEQCRGIAILLAKEWQDKFTLAKMFGVSERTIRDRISSIAKQMPVISTSDSKGYKLALNSNDLTLAKQSSSELYSRARETLYRKKVLDNFIAKFEQRSL